MTQPLPDAAAQKQAAVEVFAQYEPPLYEAYLAMMTEWLAAVRSAMFAGGVAKLALVPDPFTVFSQTPLWLSLVERYSEDVAREVLAAPYKSLFKDGTIFESRPFVHNYIAARVNRLKDIPTEVYSAVSQIVDAATKNGASIPDVTEQVHELLDATHGDMWKNRAKTVARTEVVGAYNGGLHDAFSMIVGNTTGITWMKRWLATDDQRTRPDHREADGQLVPFSQPFIVGGYPMMHPHAPEAPAKEVVSCRCVELLEEKGKPTSMTNRQTKLTAALTLADLTLANSCQFCLQTHKPGLCKGQKRGETEPGTQDANQAVPARKAQVAVVGLSRAIAQAHQVEAQNAVSNPRLAAMARRAVADYQKALRPHQQALRDAARANAQAGRQGQRDAQEQNTLDRRQQALEKQAQAILDRRKEQEKLAKMTPKQRAEYRRRKAAMAVARRRAAEDAILKRASG